MGKAQSGAEQGLWMQAAWVHIPALPLASCGTSDKSLNLPVLWFLHLYSGGDNTIQRILRSMNYCQESSWGSNISKVEVLERVLLALMVYHQFRGWPWSWESVTGMYWDIAGDLVP